MSKYDSLYPIKLIDTYSQSATNFDLIKAEGYTGVLFKAGQWYWGDVPRLKPDWLQMAADVGLFRGWYFVCDSRGKYTINFETLAKWTKMDPLELGIWNDVEKPYWKMTDADYWNTPYAGWDNHYNFMRMIKETGASKFPNKMPGLYTSPGQFNLIFRNLSPAAALWFAMAPLWTAQYNENLNAPNMYGAWNEWKLWQVQGEPDINHFHGTEAEFKEFFQINVPPEEDMKYIGQITAAAVNVRVLGQIVGAITQNVMVEGTRMWDDGTYMRMAIDMTDLQEYLYSGNTFDPDKEYYIATGHNNLPQEWVTWEAISIETEELHEYKNGEVVQIWVPKP